MLSATELLEAARYMSYVAQVHAKTWLAMKRRLQSRGCNITHMRVLDVGCGTLYPYTLLCHSRGIRVTGADLCTLRPRSLGLTQFFEDVEYGGSRFATRRQAANLARRLFYYRPLAKMSGMPVKHKGVDLVTTDMTRLKFPAESFDLVVSFAAIEHVLDIPKAASELHRVLKPGGVAHLNIHLWTSISGGHEQEFWTDEIPRGITPWQHLRNPKWTSDIPLNRYREQDYLGVFANLFELEHREVERELGRDLITNDLLKALPGYSSDELAIEMLVLILRKPEGSAISE
jgi:SAM-dependent methyltransferase